MTATSLAQPLPFRVLLDEAVRHARRHFRRIYPPVAVPLALAAGALPLAQGVFFRNMPAAGRAAPSPAVMLSGFAGFMLVISVWLALYLLGYGALLAAAVDAVAERQVSMARAWRLMLRPRVLGTLVLAGIAVALGLCLCLLPGIYAGLVFSLTVPVMVEESRFGSGAMRRSAELARYNPQHELDGDPRFKVFVVLFVGTLLGYVVNLVVQLPMIVVQQVMMFREVAGGRQVDPADLMARMAWIQVPSQMAGMLTNTAVHVYMCFGLALLFFDVKRRKEGLDLEAAITRLVESRRREVPGAPLASTPAPERPPS